jgi:hypothetical protein
MGGFQWLEAYWANPFNHVLAEQFPRPRAAVRQLSPKDTIRAMGGKLAAPVVSPPAKKRLRKGADLYRT